VHRAIDCGINCLDTAKAYGIGVSEQALSRALGSRRRDVSIVTKFGASHEEMPTRRDSSRERVMASIERSLPK
jgi:aryl-alcohol dehydrogenase-like predicted oxidoreductase